MLMITYYLNKLLALLSGTCKMSLLKLVSHNGTKVTKERVSSTKYSVGSLRKNVA